MKRSMELTHAAHYIQQVCLSLSADQSTFLVDLVSHPPTSTTTATLTSADAFDIDKYVQNSTQIRHATGSEPLPPETGTGKPKRIRMTRPQYEALLEFYKVAYGRNQSVEDYRDPKLGQKVVQPNIEMFASLRLQGNS